MAMVESRRIERERGKKHYRIVELFVFIREKMTRRFNEYDILCQRISFSIYVLPLNSLS